MNSPGQLDKHIHQHIFTIWISLESESTRVNPHHYNQTLFLTNQDAVILHAHEKCIYNSNPFASVFSYKKIFLIILLQYSLKKRFL